MMNSYDEEEHETVMVFCQKCRLRVPDDVKEEETVTKTGDTTKTVSRGYCPNCGVLVFESESIERDGGISGSSGALYGEVIVLPDDCIAVFDEEEL